MRKLLTVEKGRPSADIRELLSANIIGTPGQSLVYQHTRVGDKLDAIDRSFFLSVRLGSKAIGACCFIPRTVYIRANGVDAFYIRYFSFRNSFRASSKPYKHLSRKTSALRDEITQCLDGDGLNKIKPLAYAYVDESNFRSKDIIDSFGFKKIGSFKVKFLSRFFPKEHGSVEEIQAKELGEFKKRVEEEYAEHSFVALDNIGFENGAYVFNENGRIVAGIQTYKERWKIHEVPGSTRLLSIVSIIPLIKTIFNRDFRFLSIEGFFCHQGYEHTLEPLIETALARSNRNTAVACVDHNSLFYNRLCDIPTGVIQYMTKEKEIALVARGRQDALDWLSKRPIYVSSFDNM
ncbi:MAG: hypothetical protein JXR10_08470 [Cyclobacteriaceae bacterium]